MRKERNGDYSRLLVTVIVLLALSLTFSALSELDESWGGIFLLYNFPGFIVYVLTTGDMHGWNPGPIGQAGRVIVTALGSWTVWSLVALAIQKPKKAPKDSAQSRIRNSMDFFKLLESLERAIHMMSQAEGGPSGEFRSVEEFTDRLRLAKDRIGKTELTELQNLKEWFAPTSVWDNFAGEDGITVGTEVFELTEKLIKKI